MNEQELKQLWQRQVLAPPAKLPDAQVVQAMKQKMSQFGRTIFWRDVREVAACLLVIFLFLPGCFKAASWLSQTGCLVEVFSAIFIAFRLVYSKRRDDRNLTADSLRGYLLHERRKIETQIRLLSTVLWWYILPLYIGAVMVAFGIGRGGMVHKFGFAIFYAVVCGGIWWLNQYAVKKHLLPLKAELDQTLQEIPESSETKTSHE